MLKIFLLITISMQANSQSAENNWIDACAKLEFGDYAESHIIFNELAKGNHTWNGRLWLYKGISEYHTTNFAEAKKDLGKASLNQLPEANLWLARIAVLSHEQHAAIDNLGAYLLENTNANINFILKDSLFTEIRQSDAWIKLEQKHANNPLTEADADVDFYISKGRYSNAMSSINRISAKTDAELAALHSMRSRVYFAEMSTQLAINEINQALALRPAYRKYLVLKVNFLLALNESENAMKLLNELLEKYPEDFDLRKKRITTAIIIKEFEGASKDLEIILRYFPDNENLFLSGKIDYEMGHYLRAMKTFSLLIEQEPSSADYFKARGMTYFQTKTLDQAAYDLSMSLDLRPDDAETNFFLGLTERRRGNMSLSCYYITRALKYGEPRAVEHQQADCK